MATAVSFPPVFGSPARLPRGPHALGRDEVVASQRARLLAAVTEVVAEKGYAGTTITAVARHAGVSPNVFYEHFADKETCYLAAYEVFAQTLLARIAGEIAPTAGWQDFIVAALSSYLGTLEAEPTVARGFLLEMNGAGPLARERRHAAYAAIAAAIQQRHEELRRRDPGLGPLPQLAYMGTVHGIRELVCDALESRTESPLTDLIPQIVHWISATFEGAAAAGEQGAP